MTKNVIKDIFEAKLAVMPSIFQDNAPEREMGD